MKSFYFLMIVFYWKINIYIAVSAAVLAYGRIHMNKFKKFKDLKIYYYNTYSMFTFKNY
jgi:hypothetical protein